MRIVILGAPGSGKRTQTSLLAEKYGLKILTSGELVKRAMGEESERGLQLRLLQQAGQPVTDDIVLNLLQEQLQEPDLRAGFILDGFPRNLLQALTLDELLGEMGQSLDFVLLIHIETDVLMERLVGRRICRTCGAVYNIYTNPAVVEDVCDLCGGRLHQRAEYNEETVSSRLHVFDHLTSPLLSHYGKLNKVLRVDGEGEVEEVFTRVCEAVDGFLESRETALEAEVPPGETHAVREPAIELIPENPGEPERPAMQGSELPGQSESAKPRAKSTPVSKRGVADRAGLLKKAEVDKAASKKASPKKAAAKKAAPKQAASKKAVPKKAAPKKAAPKKAAPKKAAPKKAAPKKAAPKKAAPKKAVPKKAVPKKAVPKKAVPKKAVPKKAVPKKAAPKKAVPKKVAQKNAAKKKSSAAPAASNNAKAGSRKRKR